MTANARESYKWYLLKHIRRRELSRSRDGYGHYYAELRDESDKSDLKLAQRPVKSTPFLSSAPNNYKFYTIHRHSQRGSRPKVQSHKRSLRCVSQQGTRDDGSRHVSRALSRSGSRHMKSTTYPSLDEYVAPPRSDSAHANSLTHSRSSHASKTSQAACWSAPRVSEPLISSCKASPAPAPTPTPTPTLGVPSKSRSIVDHIREFGSYDRSAPFRLEQAILERKLERDREREEKKRKEQQRRSSSSLEVGAPRVPPATPVTPATPASPHAEDDAAEHSASNKSDDGGGKRDDDTLTPGDITWSSYKAVTLDTKSDERLREVSSDHSASKLKTAIDESDSVSYEADVSADENNAATSAFDQDDASKTTTQLEKEDSALESRDPSEAGSQVPLAQPPTNLNSTRNDLLRKAISQFLTAVADLRPSEADAPRTTIPESSCSPSRSDSRSGVSNPSSSCSNLSIRPPHSSRTCCSDVTQGTSRKLTQNEETPEHNQPLTSIYSTASILSRSEHSNVCVGSPSDRVSNDAADDSVERTNVDSQKASSIDVSLITFFPASHDIENELEDDHEMGLDSTTFVEDDTITVVEEKNYDTNDAITDRDTIDSRDEASPPSPDHDHQTTNMSASQQSVFGDAEYDATFEVGTSSPRGDATTYSPQTTRLFERTATENVDTNKSDSLSRIPSSVVELKTNESTDTSYKTSIKSDNKDEEELERTASVVVLQVTPQSLSEENKPEEENTDEHGPDEECVEGNEKSSKDLSEEEVKDISASSEQTEHSVSRKKTYRRKSSPPKILTYRNTLGRKENELSDISTDLSPQSYESSSNCFLARNIRSKSLHKALSHSYKTKVRDKENMKEATGPGKTRDKKFESRYSKSSPRISQYSKHEISYIETYNKKGTSKTPRRELGDKRTHIAERNLKRSQDAVRKVTSTKTERKVLSKSTYSSKNTFQTPPEGDKSYSHVGNDSDVESSESNHSRNRALRRITSPTHEPRRTPYRSSVKEQLGKRALAPPPAPDQRRLVYACCRRGLSIQSTPGLSQWQRLSNAPSTSTGRATAPSSRDGCSEKRVKTAPLGATRADGPTAPTQDKTDTSAYRGFAPPPTIPLRVRPSLKPERGIYELNIALRNTALVDRAQAAAAVDRGGRHRSGGGAPAPNWECAGGMWAAAAWAEAAAAARACFQARRDLVAATASCGCAPNASARRATALAPYSPEWRAQVLGDMTSRWNEQAGSDHLAPPPPLSPPPPPPPPSALCLSARAAAGAPKGVAVAHARPLALTGGAGYPAPPQPFPPPQPQAFRFRQVHDVRGCRVARWAEAGGQEPVTDSDTDQDPEAALEGGGKAALLLAPNGPQAAGCGRSRALEPPADTARRWAVALPPTPMGPPTLSMRAAGDEAPTRLLDMAPTANAAACHRMPMTHLQRPPNAAGMAGSGCVVVEGSARGPLPPPAVLERRLETLQTRLQMLRQRLREERQALAAAAAAKARAGAGGTSSSPQPQQQHPLPPAVGRLMPPTARAAGGGAWGQRPLLAVPRPGLLAPPPTPLTPSPEVSPSSSHGIFGGTLTDYAGVGGEAAADQADPFQAALRDAAQLCAQEADRLRAAQRELSMLSAGAATAPFGGGGGGGGGGGKCVGGGGGGGGFPPMRSGLPPAHWLRRRMQHPANNISGSVSFAGSSVAPAPNTRRGPPSVAEAAALRLF